MVVSRVGCRGGGSAAAVAGGAGWRCRQAAWRHLPEHQRRRPAGVKGWPQAGQAAVSLRLSLRGAIVASGIRRGCAAQGWFLAVPVGLALDDELVGGGGE